MLLLIFKIVTLFLSLVATLLLINRYIQIWVNVKNGISFDMRTVVIIQFTACFWSLFIGSFL